MIHHITGKITSLGAQSLVIDMNGWGIELFVPSAQTHILGEQTTFYTHLHWNQETGPQLFGFATTTQRGLFSLLINCQGIGPKLALVLLSTMETSECIEALQVGNIDKLSSVKGLGAKKAELLVLHARSKRETLSALQASAPSSPHSPKNSFDDVYQALQALRYSPAEITPVLQALHKDAASYQATFDVLMRRALSLLAQSGRP